MRARIAAVLGRPTPMKTERLSRSSRAAAIVWTSPLMTRRSGSRPRGRARPSGAEALAVAADGVPLAVEGVVALGDPVRVGRPRPAGGLRDDVDHPAGDDDAART